MGPLAVDVPAGVEGAAVALDPRLGGLVQGVAGAGAEVHEERLRGVDRAQVADEGGRLLGEVRGEVVALLGRLGRVGEVVVVDEAGVVLVGLAAEEAGEAVEAAAQGPAVIGAHRILHAGQSITS